MSLFLVLSYVLLRNHCKPWHSVLSVAQRMGSSKIINLQVHLTSNRCEGYDHGNDKYLGCVRVWIARFESSSIRIELMVECIVTMGLD